MLDLLSLRAQRGNLVGVVRAFQHGSATAGARLPRMPDGILTMTDKVGTRGFAAALDTLAESLSLPRARRQSTVALPCWSAVDHIRATSKGTHWTSTSTPFSLEIPSSS